MAEVACGAFAKQHAIQTDHHERGCWTIGFDTGPMGHKQVGCTAGSRGRAPCVQLSQAGKPWWLIEPRLAIL